MRRIISIIGVALVPALGSSGAEAKLIWAPMNETTIATLYSGKTWLWAGGAAYFAPYGRFKAWAQSKGVRSIAYGKWEVRPDGVMCFKAAWKPLNASKVEWVRPVRSCFEHSMNGSNIVQRKEPSGCWYVFGHAPPRPNDEIRKLVEGDHTRLRG